MKKWSFLLANYLLAAKTALLVWPNFCLPMPEKGIFSQLIDKSATNLSITPAKVIDK